MRSAVKQRPSRAALLAEMDRRAAQTFAAMDAINAKPLDPDLLRPEPWANVGGGAGFSINGADVSTGRPREW
jgi:hypothetical protein